MLLRLPRCGGVWDWSLHLLAEGHRAIGGYRDFAVRERLGAIDRTAGLLTGCYGREYLADLREDWPA